MSPGRSQRERLSRDPPPVRTSCVPTAPARATRSVGGARATVRRGLDARRGTKSGGRGRCPVLRPATPRASRPGCGGLSAARISISFSPRREPARARSGPGARDRRPGLGGATPSPREGPSGRPRPRRGRRGRPDPGHDLVSGHGDGHRRGRRDGRIGRSADRGVERPDEGAEPGVGDLPADEPGREVLEAEANCRAGARNGRPTLRRRETRGDSPYANPWKRSAWSFPGRGPGSQGALRGARREAQHEAHEVRRRLAYDDASPPLASAGRWTRRRPLRTPRGGAHRRGRAGGGGSRRGARRRSRRDGGSHPRSRRRSPGRCGTRPRRSLPTARRAGTGTGARGRAARCGRPTPPGAARSRPPSQRRASPRGRERRPEWRTTRTRGSRWACHVEGVEGLACEQTREALVGGRSGHAAGEPGRPVGIRVRHRDHPPPGALGRLSVPPPHEPTPDDPDPEGHPDAPKTAPRIARDLRRSRGVPSYAGPGGGPRARPAAVRYLFAPRDRRDVAARTWPASSSAASRIPRSTSRRSEPNR